jgi:hypothetical protein
VVKAQKPFAESRKADYCDCAYDQEGIDMDNAFAPAIAALQAELAELDRKSRELKGTINVLCKHAGQPELYQNIGAEAGTATVAGIKADTFYGKTIATAAREYLEMRKASNLGPATPREIYEALVEGGYQFEAKSKDIAMVGLRSNLRKNSKTFHRLPNGQYGLLSWYPNAKAAKASAAGNGDDSEPEEAETKSAADTRSAAESSEAPINDQEGGASEPQQEEDEDGLANHP